MGRLSDVYKQHDPEPNIRLLTILTVLFFATLVIGTGAAGLFLRESIKEERRALAHDRIENFSKALETIFQFTAHGAETLTTSLENNNGPDIARFKRQAATFLAASPWTKAIILRRPEQSFVIPQDASEDMLGLPVPPGDVNDAKFFGPYTLADGEEGLIYRIRAGSDILELVIGVRSLVKEVGLLELGGSTQLSVHTDGTATDTAVAGNANLEEDETVGSSFDIGNSKWTIRVRPAPLDEGPNDWIQILLMFAAVLALAFLTPFIGLILLLRARLRDERRLNDSMKAIDDLSRQLDVALQASNIGLWEHDLETGQQIWDDQILRIYGIEGKGHVYSFDQWLTFLHPDDRPRFRTFKWIEDGETGFHHEYRIITPAGVEKTIRSAGNSFRDARGHRKFVGVNWDFSRDKKLQAALEEARAKAEAQNLELEQARQQMEKIALEDPLTNVANRRHFEEKLDTLQAEGHIAPGTTIILIDLDGFKTLNDTMGHLFGDEVLRFAADTFCEKLGPGAFLARTGGDEFVIMMPPGSDVDQFSQDLATVFARPVQIDDRVCRVGVSIGIAEADGDTTSARDLLVKADLALYEAKNRGRGRTVRYTHELMEQTFALKQLADDLHEALERDQITAFYQPIFDTRDMKIIGVEALARWHHPKRGLMEPKGFIDVAEQMGLLHRIDEIVFGKAICMMRRCEAEGIALPVLSANVSAQRLQDPGLISALDAIDLPAGRFHFELLESIPFDDGDNALLKVVNMIRAKGFGIDLDDFGSGYASLVGLTQVRPDRLKIAGQLIEPILRSPESLLIVETIVQIAESFGIDVICEGVLSREHREKLDMIGCHIQQGFHFSRPMDERQIVEFLAQNQR